MYLGGTASGSTHDLTLLKEDPPDLGILTRIMSKYYTPEPDRPALYVDKGYWSISGYYPGATIRQPAKRRPNSDRQTGGLAADELALKKNNGTLIVVEHAIGMIKQYRITTKPFWNTPKEFNDGFSDGFSIISELVNLNRDWDRIKEETGPWYDAGQEKGTTLTPGWSGATQQPLKSLHTTVLPSCARPSVSGVIKACRFPTKGHLRQISSQTSVHQNTVRRDLLTRQPITHNVS